MYITLSLC